ncbi:MAG: DUF1307 domain-containing protein [Erysipelotrichia bacterium]|nr:DUF1307 domain-containing protein [Erysipelotrichia bacterium]NCC53970.1 DUF1307 domain-containing protein [Erysipelotrichia bacterium]
MMKKLMMLLVSVFAVVLLSGCSEDSTPKKCVCSGVIDGVNETLVFEGEGDKLVKWSEKALIPLSLHGLDAQSYANDPSQLDLDLIRDATLELMFNDTDVKGVKAEVSVEGENIVLDMVVDYTKVDLKALKKAGVVESDQDEIDYISYQESIEVYKDMHGLKCTEKKVK